MIAFIRSFGYAIKGIGAAFHKQVNIKVHFIAALVVIGAGLMFSVSSIEWCVLLLTIGLVISLEMVNCALENLVNLVSPDYHPLAGKVKDIAAGAVLIASIIAATVGIIIFFPYFISL
jgi:diacylglycerol kinase